jgi:hypothetical protein
MDAGEEFDPAPMAAYSGSHAHFAGTGSGGYLTSTAFSIFPSASVSNT